MNYGRYQIMDEIGKGSTGIVYRALDPDIGRHVALKVLGKDKIGNTEFEHRFFKEAKVFGKLSHPNIVMIHDIGRDHSSIFIAMELVEGKPLDKFFSGNMLSMKHIIRIIIQVASALHYAHEKGVIHRDIKPSNILTIDDCVVKLTDFGVARIEDGTEKFQTTAGDIIGTPAYMSPEQINSEPLDGRCDLFSLGVILYEYLCGSRPFTGKNLPGLFLAIANLNPKPPHQINSDIPVDLSQIILKSLAKKPAKRFQSGQEMAEALQRYWNWEPQRSKVSRLPSWLNKRSIALCAALVFGLSIAGAVIFHYLPPETSTVSEHVSPTLPPELSALGALPIIPVPLAVKLPSPPYPRTIPPVLIAPIPSDKPVTDTQIHLWKTQYATIERELFALEQSYQGIQALPLKIKDRLQAVQHIEAGLDTMRQHIETHPGSVSERQELLDLCQRRKADWLDLKSQLEAEQTVIIRAAKDLTAWRELIVKHLDSLKHLENQYSASAVPQNRLRHVQQILRQCRAIESLISAETNLPADISALRKNVIQQRSHWSAIEKKLRLELFQAEYERRQKQINDAIQQFYRINAPEHNEQKIRIATEIIRKIDDSQSILASSPLDESDKQNKSNALARLKQEWYSKKDSLTNTLPGNSYQRLKDSLGLDEL